MINCWVQHLLFKCQITEVGREQVPNPDPPEGPVQGFHEHENIPKLFPEVWQNPSAWFIHNVNILPVRMRKYHIRDKSLLELWDTTFLPDWLPTLIFVWFISNFLCIRSISMSSAHVILK